MWRKFVLMALLLSALGIAAVQPAQAQAGIIWDAAFYNNPNLYDVPALRRQDAAINFNWGAGSPGQGVNADDFSGRWGADVYLNTGTYRFTARADDAIRIWIDYGRDPLINTWDRNQVNQTVTADIYLNAGTHHIQVDYREFTGEASAFASFANVNGSQPSFPQPTQIPPVVQQPVPDGQWTAQYFANTSLAGSPSLIQSENTPARNWSNGSPAPSIPADNWSGRWTTIQYLNAGNYQLRVRADDGVRVFVDGLAVINEWHQASDQTYTANLNLTAGQHSFLVEYYEAGGIAFLEYSLSALIAAPAPVPTSVPPVVINPTGLTATVTAGRLNVRDQPNAFNGRIILTLDRNNTFPVVASNPGNTWIQLNINGTLGWVNAGYIRLNTVPTQPQIPTQIPPGATGYSVIASPYAVNIRNAPNVTASVVARLPLNSTAAVLGRNFDSTWYQVSYNGIVGWVSAPYAPLLPGSDVGRIPISL